MEWQLQLWLFIYTTAKAALEISRTINILTTLNVAIRIKLTFYRNMSSNTMADILVTLKGD